MAPDVSQREHDLMAFVNLLDVPGISIEIVEHSDLITPSTRVSFAAGEFFTTNDWETPGDRSVVIKCSSQLLYRNPDRVDPNMRMNAISAELDTAGIPPFLSQAALHAIPALECVPDVRLYYGVFGWGSPPDWQTGTAPEGTVFFKALSSEVQLYIWVFTSVDSVFGDDSRPDPQSIRFSVEVDLDQAPSAFWTNRIRCVEFIEE